MSSVLLGKPQTPPTFVRSQRKGRITPSFFLAFSFLTLRLVKGFASRLIRRPLTWALACIVSILCTCLKVSCDWLQHRTRLPTRPHPGDNPTNRHTPKKSSSRIIFWMILIFALTRFLSFRQNHEYQTHSRFECLFRHIEPSPDYLYALNSDNTSNLFQWNRFRAFKRSVRRSTTLCAVGPS